MAKVFISYSRKDIEFAKRLTAELQTSELDFWIDWEGIPPTVDWWREIEKGIEEADVFLFLISPDSAKSKVCGQEIEVAVKNGKRIIPIVVHNVDWQDTPSSLRHLNYIFFRENDDFNPSVQKLMIAIRTDYEWVAAHRRLQVKALEWERNHQENSFLLRGKDLQDAEFQLATNTSKEPHPTDLQREYVFTSRRATDRQRKILTSTAVGVAIALAALAIFGFAQARQASSNAATAQAANTLASNNAATAISNAEEAKRQAQFARVGELSAQSTELRDRKFQTSLLLGIEAYQRIANAQSREVILNNAQAQPQLLMFLNEHTGSVQSVAFSPDGSMLASGGADHTVILWDATTGIPLGPPLTGHKDQISSLIFNPEGSTLASVSPDGIILWDMVSHPPIARPLRDSIEAERVAFVRDGMTFASFHSDSSLTLWDVKTGTQLALPMAVQPQASDVTFSPDGTTLAYGDGLYDGTLHLWDINTQTSFELPLSGLFFGTARVAFSPDGKMIAASRDSDSEIVLWDLETRELIAQLPTEPNPTGFQLAFSPDGKMLASSSDDGTITLWNVTTSRTIGQPLIGHAGGVNSLSFSSNGKLLASGSEDGTVILWNVATTSGSLTEEVILETGNPIAHPLVGNDAEVDSLLFSRDGNALISRNYIGGVLLWDLETKELVRPAAETFVRGMAFSPENRALIADESNGVITITDLLTGKPIGRQFGEGTQQVLDIVFSPDFTKSVSIQTDNSMILWDLATGKPVGSPLVGHTAAIKSVAFSPDGKTLASGGFDETIILWDALTGAVIDQMLTEEVGRVLSVTFSPDGKVLASAGMNNIILWRMATRQPMDPPLQGHTAQVSSVAFSPDGAILASGDADSTIILWDLATRQPIAQPLTASTARISFENLVGITSLVFSPDGSVLASGDGNSSILLWDTEPQAWIEKTCQRVRRNLTQAEWDEYFPEEPYHKTCEQWPME